MFQRLFGRKRHANRAITDAVYGAIVAAARQPLFYSAWNVPDTPLGRFEMLSLHMFLFMRRMRGENDAASRELAQVLTDEFFSDVEQSLRELGIGDMGVPKRMKKLARMFYGRTGAYADALDAGDQSQLAAALMRNVRPDEQAWPQAADLAAYMAGAEPMLASQPADAILAGTLEFPDATKS
ncbi:ubiquinol-cytochrome C chaperone [Mesorhizobium sp. NBSH29]|uniref:ubiquinol-cytochrome C chaperone family protein n=1 Tax=Mesorhizobium sp. NBSH29 TaxID=2654249 RepID=UPI0018967909|nr:ubiquinol-cytochrome C chaperone family protein [Mesorhizobium sp. NBSH29]QPC87378.1 ubiquinol-cytochrome C chaperone [Mesorhizobium sp. NBSH29]